jgi:hypothetical protein
MHVVARREKLKQWDLEPSVKNSVEMHSGVLAITIRVITNGLRMAAPSGLPIPLS